MERLRQIRPELNENYYMKKILLISIALVGLLVTDVYANGFRQLSIGSGKLPTKVMASAPLNYVPGNPVTVSGVLDVPPGQTIDGINLIVNVDGTETTYSTLDASSPNQLPFVAPAGNSSTSFGFSISSGTIPAGNASITIKALSGSTVLYSDSYAGSASIPDQIGNLLTDSDITTGSLDLTASDLVGVLENDGSVAIDSDILSNLTALNAEIDEDDHGCTLAGGANATGAQGRDYLICVMEAHYADVAAAALASFTAPTTTQLESCNTDELCGPAPSICSETIWTCTVTSSTLPSTGTLSPGFNGPSNAPASFDGIDTTQQLGSATYNVALSLATYTNPIPSTSFTYSNLAYPSDVYSAPSASSTGLTASSVTPLLDFSVDTSTGFNYVNATNSVTYTATLSDGTALPSWISIDSSTGVLSGSGPVGFTSTDFTITATDAQGGSFSQTQSLTSNTTVPAGALATYQAADTLNGNTYQFRSWRDDHSGITFPSKINVTNGRYVSFSTTPDNGNTRLDPADMLTLLNATNLTSPTSDPNGLRDVNGNLITIASNSGEGAGYLVVGIGPRTDSSWQHGLLQVVPISGTSYDDHTSTGTAQTTTSLFVANKPYGVIADTASDAGGMLAITGTTTSGQTLTADVSGITDPDGFNLAGSQTDKSGLSYQWLADGTAISGATSSTFTLGADQVDAAITVQVSYTDSAFYTETITSSATVAVNAPAANGTGSVAITGTVEEYETLTADTSSLADADGMGTLSYQWLADGSDISGATSSTLALTQSHVGQLISVRVSYTDTLGTQESFTSDQTVAVVDIIYQSQPDSLAFNSNQGTTVSGYGNVSGYIMDTGNETRQIVPPTGMASGSTISYTSNTPSVCTVSGSTLTGIRTGNCSLTATISKDGYYDVTVTDSEIPIQVRYCQLVQANQGANCPDGYQWATEAQAFNYSWYTGSQGHRCGYVNLSNDDVNLFHNGATTPDTILTYTTDRKKIFHGGTTYSFEDIGNVNGKKLHDTGFQTYSWSYSGGAVEQAELTSYANVNQIGRDVCVSDLTSSGSALAISYGAGVSTTEPVEMTVNSAQYLTASGGTAPYRWRIILTDNTYTPNDQISGWHDNSPGAQYAGLIGGATTGYCGHNPVPTKLSVSETKAPNVIGRLDMCEFIGSDDSGAYISARGDFGSAPAGTNETFYFKVEVRDADGNIYTAKRYYTFSN